MIGWLQGQVVGDEADGTVTLAVGGVGYEVITPLGTLGRARAEDGTTTLHVHTLAREDALMLYGFSSIDERSAFRTLISISKVGPKLALAVLSAVEVGQLQRVVETGDAKQLTRVPGVGKKTAERMILELEGKLKGLSGAPAKATATPAPTGVHGAAADALVRMGFKPAETERAIASVPDPDAALGELIRQALAILTP